VNAAQQEVQNAQIQISNAQMNVGNMQKQFEMQDKLYKQGVASKQDFLNAQQQLFLSSKPLKMLNSN
jgi:HlyD family secretion protein